MGLDMYLYRRNKLRENDKLYNELAEIAKKEVCYWRKANQIRQWFVNHTDLHQDDNCREIELTKEELETLMEDCKSVLENHNLASKILPTASGFFFGSTNYDEYYFDDLKETVETIKEILETTDFDNEVIIYDEWW